MSDIDIYDETENLISSDEYSEDDSEDDDEEDDLMNAAVSSRNISSPSKNAKTEENKKVKEIKLLLKRRKFCSIYKKKSINWLNSKQKRNKYKQYLLTLTSENAAANQKQLAAVLETEKNCSVKLKEENIPETISLDETDVEISPCKSSEPAAEEKNIETKADNLNDLKTYPNEKQDPICVSENNVNDKRSRSLSPVECSVDEPTKNCEQEPKPQPDIRKSPSLYKEINEMFPKYDEVIENHIKSTNNTVKGAIEGNLARVLTDIQTLDDILKTKEMEWNKLLHLKIVKEEILSRLIRKKHIIEMKDKRAGVSKYTLAELKELELYLSTYDSEAPSSSLSSIQQLIENRANMKREDLEKERINTSRLQSILVSNNILSTLSKNNHHSVIAKDNSLQRSFSSSSSKTQQPSQSYQYFENNMKSNIGRQGPFKDVKSIIADFRQNNPEVLPRVGKRIKLNEPISGIRNLQKQYISQPIDVENHVSLSSTFNSGNGIYSSTLEKLLSTSCRSNDSLHIKGITSYPQEHNLNSQKNCYRLKNLNNELCNEISITPVSNDNRYFQKENNHNSNSEKLRSALHKNIEQNLIYLDEIENGKQHTKDVRNNNFSENEIQICQECRNHEARFVCAGCGNQWYCSRNCQITAWDKHSETCIE